eukprot:93890-Prorocentrum_minimum.AAC.1
MERSSAHHPPMDPSNARHPPTDRSPGPTPAGGWSWSGSHGAPPSRVRWRGPNAQFYGVHVEP